MITKVLNKQVTADILDKVDHLAHATGNGCAYVGVIEIEEAIENGEVIPDELLSILAYADRNGCGDIFLHL